MTTSLSEYVLGGVGQSRGLHFLDDAFVGGHLLWQTPVQCPHIQIDVWLRLETKTRFH